MLNKMNQNRQIVRFLFVVLLIALPLIILVSLFVVFSPFNTGNVDKDFEEIRGRLLNEHGFDIVNFDY